MPPAVRSSRQPHEDARERVNRAGALEPGTQTNMQPITIGALLLKTASVLSAREDRP